MNRTRFSPKSLVLIAALAAVFPFSAQAQLTSTPNLATVNISLGAQPLGQALNEFARQANLQLSFPPPLVANKTAPAIYGNLTPRQALDRLLAGSGLIATVDGRVVVIKAAQLPLTEGNNETELPEVKVQASSEALPGDLPKPYAGGQVARGGRLGMLGNTNIMDAPVSITSYTAQSIANQQARSLGDVLVLEPSIRTTISGGNAETFYIRVFQRASFLEVRLRPTSILDAVLGKITRGAHDLMALCVMAKR